MPFQFFRGPQHVQNSGKHNVLEDSWTLLRSKTNPKLDLLHFYTFLNYRGQQGELRAGCDWYCVPERSWAILSDLERS